MIKVWGRPNSINVMKVMWTAAELDLAVERVDVGGSFGGLDDAYAAKNPNRRIPTIEDGALVLWESNAIVRYLAARYGAGKLWAADPAVRADADKWMDWQATEIAGAMREVFWQLVRTAPADRDAKLIAESIATSVPRWTLIDAHLAGRTYLCGDTLTMGDVPLGCYAHRWFALPIERPDLPHLEAWYRRLAERRAYAAHVMLPLT
jgi:glutathione S-transferase